MKISYSKPEEKQTKKTKSFFLNLIKYCLWTSVFLFSFLWNFSFLIPWSASSTTPISTQNTVFASGDVASGSKAQVKTDTDDKKLAETLTTIVKVFYVFLRPLLWIAWLAMDNSLIYGEIFHLDTALFKFWQIARNLANFLIGFLFVRQVVKYIMDIKWGKSATATVWNIIKKLLIATIWVNMSWFLMGALVDLSSILTVGVGWLPLNLSSTQIATKPIFWVKTSVRLNTTAASNDNLVILYTSAWLDGKYMLPCFVEENKIIWEKKRWFAAFGLTEEGAAPKQDATDNKNTASLTVSPNEITEEYCMLGQDILSKSKAWDITVIPWDDGFINAINNSRTEFNGKCGVHKEEDVKNSKCNYMGNIAKKWDGQQGAFYSLYISLLNLSSIHVDTPQTTASLSTEAIVKIIIALAYIIPMFILAIVLIVRVAYLWMIIAFSPIIVLSMVPDLIWKNNFITGKLKLNMENILSLLLLPVVVTFVISISIVVLGSLTEWIAREWTLAAMGIYNRLEAGAACYDIGITNLCINTKSINFGTGIMDMFSWILVNLFGIGLMWFAIMAALKTSKLTEKIVTDAEGLVKSGVGWLQFIPMPGGTGKTSIWALTAATKSIKQSITWSANDYQQTQRTTSALKGVIDNASGKDAALEWEIEKAINTILTDSTAPISKDIENLNNIVSNNELFNKLFVKGAQIAPLVAYANALSQKAWSNISFNNADELFNSQKWRDFWWDLANKWDLNLNNLGRLYDADSSNAASSEERNKIKEQIDAAKARKVAQYAYVIENGILKRTRTVDWKAENVEIGKSDLESMVNKYNTLKDDIAKADDDKKEGAQKIFDERKQQTFNTTNEDEITQAREKVEVKNNRMTVKIEKDDTTNTYKVVESGGRWRGRTTSTANPSTTTGATTSNTQTPPTTGAQSTTATTATTTTTTQSTSTTNTGTNTWTSSSTTQTPPAGAQQNTTNTQNTSGTQTTPPANATPPAATTNTWTSSTNTQTPPTTGNTPTQST